MLNGYINNGNGTDCAPPHIQFRINRLFVIRRRQSTFRAARACTHRFQLLEIQRRRVVRLDERLALIVNRADDQTQGEHVAQDAAFGLQLALGC